MPTINVTNATLSGKFTGSITYEDGGTTPPPTTNAKLEECIKQITPGKSEAKPLGVPHDYGWYNGILQGASSPPADFTSLTGWSQIYTEEGQQTVAGTFAVIRMTTWVRLKTGAWTKVQDQSVDGIDGGNYPGNFQGDATGWTDTKQPDGSSGGSTAPSTRCIHWWHANRGQYAANTVNGCYIELDTKVSAANMKYVVNAGIDWWRDTSAGYKPDFSNNPTAGVGNWIKVGTGYRTSYFTTLTEAELRGSNPPPPLKA